MASILIFETIDSYSRLEKSNIDWKGFQFMMSQWKKVVFATVVVGWVASVATSQPPIDGIPGSAPLGGSGQPFVVENQPQSGSAGDMIGFSSSDVSGTQTITLVDTRKFWMAVYHIDKSGKIRLVSSRPIDADFSLQLNATSPLPSEIRQHFGK